jgi:hypothetical protein
MPKLSGRDYPLSATPELSAVSSSPSFLGLGNKEKREERKAQRQTNREVRHSFRSPRCGRRGCPGQGSGMGFSGYN